MEWDVVSVFTPEGALRAVALLNIGIMPHIKWQSCASCLEEQLCHVQCGTIQAF